ncbi:acyl-CoA dehydrogenase family protein [Chloroflexota bacterium]
MDLDLSEEQEMLQKMARDFLETKYPMSTARGLVDNKIGCSPDLWREIADLGWLGLIFPGEFGGENGNFMDLLVLFEEMGRVCFLGPFFSTVLLGGIPILYAGSEEQKREFIPKICSGELLATMALIEHDVSFEPRGIALEAIPDKEHYVLSGTKHFVLDAHLANILICVVRTGEPQSAENGVTMLLVDGKSPGLQRNLLKTSDGNKQCEVIFNDVRVSRSSVLGEVNEGWPVVKKVLELATIAKCAESVGSAQRILDLTVEYAKSRQQFGQPIGTFQVIQDYCVDMLTDVETMRLAVYQAAWMLSEGISCRKEVSMTKAWVGEAYKRVALYGLKIHGGSGYMEDHDISLYFRRAQEAFSSFGNSDFHREIVAQQLEI